MTSCLTCNHPIARDRHHVARRANLAVTVLLCVRCHERIGHRERYAGIHRPLAGEPQRAWAIMHGMLALMFEHFTVLGLDTGELERTRAAMLKLITATTRDSLGPDPIAASINSMPSPSPGHGTPAQIRRRFLDGFHVTLTAAVGEWLGETILAGLPRLTPSAATLARAHAAADQLTRSVISGSAGDELTRALDSLYRGGVG